MTQIPRPDIEVNFGDFSLKLRSLKKAIGCKNNVPIAEALGVPTKSIGDWIRETSEPRLQKRRELERKIDELLLKYRIEAENPPAPPPEPEAEAEPIAEDLGDTDTPATLRPMLPEDRKWDV
jgi:hypothetical protein